MVCLTFLYGIGMIGIYKINKIFCILRNFLKSKNVIDISTCLKIVFNFLNNI